MFYDIGTKIQLLWSKSTYKHMAEAKKLVILRA